MEPEAIGERSTHRKAAASIAELVAPLSEADFLSLLRARKLTLLRGTNGARFAIWIGWDAVKRLIARGEYTRRSSDFRVSKESVLVPANSWTSDGRPDIAKLEAYLEKGFSVVLNHIDPYVPPLTSICEEIRSRLNERSNVAVVVTSGDDGAFKLHYDPEDLVIVQIEGTKRWKIFGPAVSNPVTGMPKQTPPEGASIFDEVLAPGDLLFVPGGNWHHCQAGPGRSVHIGVFLDPPASYHAVERLTAQLLADDIFRKPLTRLEPGSVLATVEADLKSRLAEKVRQLDLRAFLSERGKSM